MSAFDLWKAEYALYAEREITEADCLAAFNAGIEAAAKALEMDEQGIQELARDGTAADAIRALKSD